MIMYKIGAMRLLGLAEEEGLCISWLPDGLHIELKKDRVSTYYTCVNHTHVCVVFYTCFYTTHSVGLSLHPIDR